jgi:hypothetical protein
MIQSLVLTTLGASAFLSGSSHAETPAADANRQTPIRTLENLKVGETLNYDGNLRISFLSVIKDKRCPLKIKCSDPGDAEVVLRIKVGGKKAAEYRLHTQNKPKKLVIPSNVAKTGMTGIPKSYVIDIGTLNPLPYTGKVTPQSSYLLGLHVAVVL